MFCIVGIRKKIHVSRSINVNPLSHENRDSHMVPSVDTMVR